MNLGVLGFIEDTVSDETVGNILGRVRFNVSLGVLVQKLDPKKVGCLIRIIEDLQILLFRFVNDLGDVKKVAIVRASISPNLGFDFAVGGRCGRCVRRTT